MEPNDIIANRFQLESLVARGGMGSVYRAIDLSNQERVAVKLLFDMGGSTPQRFAREVKILSSLSHPGIVRYITHGTTEEDTPFLVMEWLEGEELATRIERGPLTIEETLLVATQTAEALSVVHAKGVVHRDLKPSNLFLVGGKLNALQLLDFGIARQDGAAAVTNTGAMVGTPQYMSPEQARGLTTLTPCADIFSLGCVLFECATGQPAFSGDHPVAVLAKLLFEETPRAKTLRADIPSAFDALLGRMLSKEPTARPTDGEALLEELRALSERQTGRMPSLALTRTERRLMAVVLSERALSRRPGNAPVTEPSSASNGPFDLKVLSGEDKTALEALQRVAKRYGGRLEPLVDGSVSVIFSKGNEVAIDLAVKAARCALALRRALPKVSLSLSMGQSEVDKVKVGSVIDNAARLLQYQVQIPRGYRWLPVRVDEASASLLSTRFELLQDQASALLLGEREERPRTLLGRPTPCIGRERELFWLESTLDECQALPRAKVLLVTAPPGVGKSRIRDEFLKRVLRREEPPSIVVGRGDSLKSEAPFALLAPALRRRFGIRDGEPEEEQQQKLWDHLSRKTQGTTQNPKRIAEFLGELCGVRFPEEHSPPLQAARQDSRLMREQLLRAFVDWLSLECRTKAQLFVFEDIQWGDRPTIQFIEYALGKLWDQPLMVVGFGRAELEARFPGLWADRGAQVLPLSTLSRKASERLISQVLGEISPERASWLAERAGGNAFYLEELCRAEAEGRGAELPATILAMAQSRLEALSADARRVLRAASIFGEASWVGGLRTLLGGEESDHEISALISQELLVSRQESRFSGEEELTFRHALLREAAYSSLTEQDRALGHRLAASWLLSAGERDAFPLAAHFERGEERTKALPWYTKAAEQALEAGDYASVIEAVRRGAACGAQGEALALLQLVEAKAHIRFGTHQDTAYLAQTAMQKFALGSAQWFEAGRLLTSAYPQLREDQRCQEVAQDMLLQRPQRGAFSSALGAWALSAKNLFDIGSFELAKKIVLRLEEAAQSGAQEPLLFAWLPHVRGQQALFLGDFGEYLTQRLAALDGFTRVDDLYYINNTEMSIGYGYFLLGLYQEAEQSLRQAMERAAQLDYPTLYGGSKHNLGLVLAYKGSFEEGYALEEEARRHFEERGALLIVAWCCSYSAQILYPWGDIWRAQKAAEEALSLMDEDNPSRPYTLAVLARSLLGQGRSAEARMHASEALDLLLRLKQIDEGESLVRLAYIEALFACGERELALEALVDAQRRLMHAATKLQNPTWRKSFVKIPENAQLLALVQRWLG